VPVESSSVRERFFDLRGTDAACHAEALQQPARVGWNLDIFAETLRNYLKSALFGEIRFQAQAIRCHKGEGLKGALNH
jgi:hypothetical protein